MFNDLYSYVPDNWKFYINESHLNGIIEKLNKHNPVEVLPSKENIFESLRYTDPEQVHTIILGYPSPQRELSSGIAYSIPFEYRFTDIHKRVPNPVVQTKVITYLNQSDTTLKELIREGVLLMNYPLTCVVRRKYAHLNYGWDIIVKNLIERLLYRTDAKLTLIAWNSNAFEIFNKVIQNWIPTKVNGVYTSPMYRNVTLIVSAGPEEENANETPLRLKYKTIAKNIPLGYENHKRFIKVLHPS